MTIDATVNSPSDHRILYDPFSLPMKLTYVSVSAANKCAANAR